MNCPARPVQSPSCVMGKDEVFDARIAFGAAMAPRSLKKDFLMSKSSTIASTTKSQDVSAPKSLPVVMRERMAAASASAVTASFLPWVERK